MLRALAVALALLAPVFAVGSSATVTDVPWWERTTMDADRDGIDDALIPFLAGSDPLIVLVDYATMPTTEERAALESAGFVITYAPRHFPLLAVRALPNQIPVLRDMPGVVFVEQNDAIERLLDRSVPLIGASAAWTSYGTTGRGVVIAVIDDGALEQHPDLRGKVAGSYDAGAPAPAVTIPGVLSVSAPTLPASSEGHGTHIAGTIVGQGGQSNGKYKGVAPDATFVDVKVFSTDGETTADIVLKGLDWTLTNMKALNIRVASMSIGGRPSDGNDALSRAVDIAVDKGLIVVAAAGNKGPSTKSITSPGAASKAITVGAVDNAKSIATFSSRGPTLNKIAKPDLVAPGVNIWSTAPPTDLIAATTGGAGAIWYKPLSGTSVAAPHVSGVIALMIQAKGDLTADEAKRILVATAQPLDATTLHNNDTGYGFVNAIAAVQIARDPSILERTEFRTRLVNFAEPAPEGFLGNLSTDRPPAESALYAILAGLAIILVGAGIGALVILRRRP